MYSTINIGHFVSILIIKNNMLQDLFWNPAEIPTYFDKLE